MLTPEFEPPRNRIADHLGTGARFGISIAAVIFTVAITSVGRSEEAVPVVPRQQAPAMNPAQPAQPQIQGNQNALELPPMEGPHLSPAPAPLEAPSIPSAFLGCWEGDPGGFDWVATDPGLLAVGSPGSVTFCYSEHEVTVPAAQVRISAGGHALDVLGHLGLGFSTFAAHGISTDVYAVTPTRMRARTKLVVVLTDHLLYLIPVHTGEPSEVDWTARITGPDTLLLEAEQIIVTSGLRMWGGWHATFHRVSASP